MWFFSPTTKLNLKLWERDWCLVQITAIMIDNWWRQVSLGHPAHLNNAKLFVPARCHHSKHTFLSYIICTFITLQKTSKFKLFHAYVHLTVSLFRLKWNIMTSCATFPLLECTFFTAASLKLLCHNMREWRNPIFIAAMSKGNT